MARPQKKVGSDFLCKLRYRNDLPPLPFAPKLVKLPDLTSRFCKYEANELVESSLHQLPADEDMGMPIDQSLITWLEKAEDEADVDQPRTMLSEEDKMLMATPADSSANAATGLTGGKGRPLVTWLRRSEYISNEDSKTATGGGSVEARFGFSARKARTTTYPDTDLQLRGIKETFKTTHLSELRHPTKPHLQAVESWPVLPDFSSWSNVYTLGQFDENPAEDKDKDQERALRQKPNEEEYQAIIDKMHKQTEHGVLRPMTIKTAKDTRENYLIWFLPDQETTERLSKRKADDLEADEEEALNFEAIRDYTYTNENYAGIQQLMLSFHEKQSDDDSTLPSSYVTYNIVKSRIVAKKKRAQNKRKMRIEEVNKPTALSITHRPLNETEIEANEKRVAEIAL
ncbi:hypothetical protein BZG36_00015 [Bifiguratus adelaidae]|uniref:RNA polymerase II-associated factor 1 homolog n=1 Tax=Bifiguratus adelaidae TaxID=1938954 RepID=A0A261Y8R1_9FUNG|nr:hypothetical protein BZG36_00015 [Bifiguratus adelaidae]